MAVVKYAAREILCKIVYYGPARSGKTTNLQWIHRSLPDPHRSDMVSLATENDRTLFFDYLPIDLGPVSGFRVRLQLYTVPGQVYYNATRRLVLRGADGVVYVADSNPTRSEENLDGLSNLADNLYENGYDILDIPLVLQYNKQDLSNAREFEELDEELNSHAAPSFAASAIRGEGVIPTLRSISELALRRLAADMAAT
jgi:hypothetical protein